MTIDTNELRKDKRPQSSITVHALLDRLEATEEDRARFLVEMGRLCAQCDALRAKIKRMEKMQDALRRHHENAMGAGLDPSHPLTKLRVSAYQQSCLYADTADALEESK